MRRVVALAACGLLVLGAAVAAGWYFLASAGPEVLRQRLESRLAATLGTQVQLGPVHLTLDRDGLELAASALRAYPSGDGADALVADGVDIQIDLWAAVAGDVRVRGLELHGPSLRLRRSQRGLELDAPARPSTAEPAPGGAARPWYEAVAAAVPRVTLEGGRVVVVDGAGRGRDLAIEGLAGSLLRRWLRGGIALQAEGALTADGEAAGRIRIEGDAGERSAWSIELRELALGSVAPVLGSRVPALGSLGLRGRVSGALQLETDRAGPAELRVQLGSARLQMRPEVAGERRALSLSDVSLEARAEGQAERWSASGLLGLGALQLPFEARLGTDGLEQLTLASVELAALPPLADALAEPDRGRARSLLAKLHGGRLEQLDLTREPGPAGSARRVRASWRIADASLDVGRASLLSGVSFGGRYDGDALELHEVRAQLDGEPLPQLDLRLAGLANIRDASELRCVQPAPASALPGRIPLVKWVQGERKPGAEPSWRRLRLEVAWLEHPALLCAVERLRGEMVPDRAGRGVEVTLDRAVWAGAPVSGSAHYRAQPEERASLRLEIGPPFEPSQPELRRSGWARGRFHFETTSLGRWKTRDAAGDFLAGGSRLLLDDVTLRLDPGPDLHGSVDLDLGQPERVPFELQAEIREGTLQDVYAAGGWTEQATGSLVGTARLRGGLRPGYAVLGDAKGSVSLHARSGVIRQPFRLFLAVAMASETLNPFRERGTIRYDAMDAELHLTDGNYVFDILQVEGPALRAAAHGSIGTIGAHPVEMVMGLFFFRTLDDVIGRLPILNRIFLGKDQNLIGAYVAITGPWDGMQASVIPTKTLMKGPVSFVFEGLPTFVRESLDRVQAMLPTSTPPPPPKEDS